MVETEILENPTTVTEMSASMFFEQMTAEFQRIRAETGIKCKRRCACCKNFFHVMHLLEYRCETCKMNNHKIFEHPCEPSSVDDE